MSSVAKSCKLVYGKHDVNRSVWRTVEPSIVSMEKAAKANHIALRETWKIQSTRIVDDGQMNCFALDHFKLFHKLSIAIAIVSFQLNGIDGGAAEWVAPIELAHARYSGRNFNSIAIFNTLPRVSLTCDLELFSRTRIGK